MDRQLYGIICRARSQAWKHVKREALNALPKGWKLHFAVGWGLTLVDEKGNAIFGTYETAPSRLPKGVRKACALAADFVETFGYDNAVIVGRKTR